MIRKIYNKNARERALLEEAYMNVYRENTEYEKALATYNNDMHDYMGSGPFKPIGPVNEKGQPKKPNPADYEDGSGKQEYEKALQTYENDMHGYMGYAGDKWTAHGPLDERGAPKKPNPADYGLSEDQEENALQPVLKEIEASGGFKETTKQAKQYQFTDSSENMQPFTYTKAKQQQKIQTNTSDGKETTNVAEPNDIIMSGPSKEQYVVKPEKFAKLYDGKVGGTVTPEQSPRMVARVDSIEQPITFKAPWGEDMILKRGDYLVQDPSGGHYRVAKQEYEQTYNPPGERG